MEWHPIATIPKEGRLFVTDGEVILSIEVGQLYGRTCLEPIGVDGYDFSLEYRLEDLTHWAPWPPLPRIQEV